MKDKLNERLHWTTTVTEKIMLGGIGGLTVVAALLEVWGMWEARNIVLADLFLLFIYTEIVGMVGAYYISNRIPVTLPIIIAMTALCRLIILHSKDADPCSRSRCYCSLGRSRICNECERKTQLREKGER